jgi:hypothetical protein
MPLIRKKRLKQSIAVLLTSIKLTDIVSDFVARVQTDNGYVESFACVGGAILSFPVSDEGRVTFDSYRSMVESDGGYAEAKFCTLNEINNLL